MLSSGNLHISDFSMNKKISLIKILKSRGPRMDFWGILLVTLAQSLYEKPVFLSKYWVECFFYTVTDYIWQFK